MEIIEYHMNNGHWVELGKRDLFCYKKGKRVVMNLRDVQHIKVYRLMGMASCKVYDKKRVINIYYDNNSLNSKEKTLANDIKKTGQYIKFIKELHLRTALASSDIKFTGGNGLYYYIGYFLFALSITAFIFINQINNSINADFGLLKTTFLNIILSFFSIWLIFKNSGWKKEYNPETIPKKYLPHL